MFIKKIVCDGLQQSGIDTDKITTPLIYSGENHTIIFLFEKNQEAPSYLAKISKTRDHIFFDKEVSILRFLENWEHQSYFSPIIYSSDTDHLRCFVTAYIPNRTLSLRHLQNLLVKPETSNLFKALHSLNPPPGCGKNFFYMPAIEAIHDLLGKAKPGYTDNVSQYSWRYLHHGDLTTENLLWPTSGAGPVLVDWEYASPGWPFFDLWHFILWVYRVTGLRQIHQNPIVIDHGYRIMRCIDNGSYSNEQLHFFTLVSIYAYLQKSGCSPEALASDLHDLVPIVYRQQ